MTAQHTPGPWKSGMDINGNPIVFQRKDDPYLCFGDINEEWQANLQLVDAAPDLLAALCAMVSAQHAGPITDEMLAAWKQGKAAIAKATGA